MRGPPQDERLSSISRGIFPVASKATEAELAKRRMQGHTPFHPACRHCQKARSVYQHRRRVRGKLESEIFAVFLFLSTTGESRADATTLSHRVLVLTEHMTNMIGAVIVSSNVAQTRAEILKWLVSLVLNPAQHPWSL